MIEISYFQMLIFISAAWLVVRGFLALKNRRINWKRELRLLAVYICLITIARIVYFPKALVNGRIGLLRFDASMMPGGIQPVPFARLFEKYDGWLINIIGNIAIFIPVGIVWPLTFKKLDSVLKATAAGFALSLFIEVSQLLFYERTSDANDLILNTLGAFIGAAVFFAIRAIKKSKTRRAA
jgi:glycopeptide antibiotics resistance protein